MENNSTWAPSLRSPTLSDPKSFSAVWSIAVALGLVAFYFLPPFAYVAYFLASTHAHVDAKNPEASFPADVQLIAQIVTYLPVALYLLIVLPPLAHATLAALGIRRITGRQLAIGILGAPVMWLATSATELLVESFTHQHSTEAAIALLGSLTSVVQKIVFVVVAVVLAPMIEELMFRVFVLNAIRRYAPAWIAIVASGLMFGFVHVSAGNQLLTVGLPLAASGMVLGAVYVRTGNYWASVITHGVFNATNVIALVFTGTKG